MKLPAILTLVFLVAPVWAAERPTKEGDIIGMATMLADGSIQMQLRSVTCTGVIAEGIVKISPSEESYQSTLNHLGGLNPSESKPIPAWPTEPCPKTSN